MNELIPVPLEAMILTDTPASLILTVGESLCVMILDPKRRLTGVCHFGLQGLATREDFRRKISDSLAPLFKEFKARGCKPSDLMVKMIGAAGPREGFYEDAVKECEAFVRKFNLPLSARSVLGLFERKVKINVGQEGLYVAKGRSLKSLNQGQSLDTPSKIKVLIVDDSKVVQMLLKKILLNDGRFEVVGLANDPIEADELLKTNLCDVMTLDMQMPRMDGITYLKKLLPKNFIPIVMISGASNQDGMLALNALEQGAVDFVEKPDSHRLRELAPVICEKVFIASQVRAVHAKARGQRLSVESPLDMQKIVVIGSSTGGTVALTQLIEQLPDSFPPIVIIQHIPAVFSEMFAKRLDRCNALTVSEAKSGDVLRPNHVFIAPGGKQLRVKNIKGSYVLHVYEEGPYKNHAPSVDIFMESAATQLGKKAIGVILTGMGSDGAKGLLNMRSQGARTIGQDEKSSVVYGMPKAAYQCGAVEIVASLDEIPQKLMSLLTKKLRKVS